MALIIGDLSQATAKSVGRQMGPNQTKYAGGLSWTGTPTGTLSLEVSNDSTDGINGTWYPKAATFSGQPAGAVGTASVELVDFAWPWLRYSWARVSGAGALSVVENTKA